MDRKVLSRMKIACFRKILNLFGENKIYIRRDYKSLKLPKICKAAHLII